MTILFAGSEPADFDSCTLSVVTTSGYYRPNVRCGLGSFGGGRATATIPASTTVWLGFRFYKNAYTSAGSNFYVVCEVGNAGGARWRLVVAHVGTPVSTWKLQYRTSGGTWTDAATYAGPLTIQVVQHVAVRLVCHASTGTVTLYMGGSPAATWTGDTTVGGLLASATYCAVVGEDSDAARQPHYSEVIIADEDIRGLSLHRLTPTGAGDANTWTGGTFAEIDETTVDDADNVWSNTAAQEANFALSDLSATLGTVRAVVVTARASRGGSGPQGLQVGLRSAGTSHLSSTLTPGTAYGPVQAVFDTNPATSQGWTAAELNAAQLALKSIT